jgi:hypothetical protein
MPLGAQTTGTTSRGAKLHVVYRIERAESQRIRRCEPSLDSLRARLPNRSNGSPSLAPFSPAQRGRRVGDEGVHKQRHRAQLKPSSKTPSHSNCDQTRYHAYRNTPVACTMPAPLGKLPRRHRPSYCAAARASLLSNPNLVRHFLLARQWVNSLCSLKPDMHNDMKRTGHEVGLPSLTSTDELEVLGTDEQFLLDRAQVMNDTVGELYGGLNQSTESIEAATHIGGLGCEVDRGRWRKTKHHATQSKPAATCCKSLRSAWRCKRTVAPRGKAISIGELACGLTTIGRTPVAGTSLGAACPSPLDSCYSLRRHR